MKLWPLAKILMRHEIAFFLGVFSFLLGEVIGVWTAEHHHIAHVTTAVSPNPKPVDHADPIVFIFFVPNALDKHSIHHGKGKL